mgnify:CR=1 FL=1
MRVSNTSERLQHIINTRKLKQIDILEAAKPYCEKYGVKLNKNDLSQYVNGKAEPGQKKLTVLSLALGVSETWLMGYDTNDSKEEENVEIHTIAAHAIRDLTDEDVEEIMKFAKYLKSKYKDK